MASSFSPTEEGGGDIIAEINITPLTDVFLVLLIIFMVTSSVIVNTGKQVNLPEGEQTTETPPKAVTVTVDKDGGIEVNGEPVDRRNLVDYLEIELNNTDEQMVILRGDREMVYDNAVFVLDAAESAGAKGFSLAVKKRPKGRR